MNSPNFKTKKGNTRIPKYNEHGSNGYFSSQMCMYLYLPAIFSLSGVLGNGVLLSAYITVKSLRSVGNEFFVNKILADICVVTVADPLCIIGKWLILYRKS